VEAPDQGLHADHNAVAIHGHRLGGAVSGIDVKEEILTIEPSDARALGIDRMTQS
jgi:hypothetical protein